MSLFLRPCPVLNRLGHSSRPLVEREVCVHRMILLFSNGPGPSASELRTPGFRRPRVAGGAGEGPARYRRSGAHTAGSCRKRKPETRPVGVVSTKNSNVILYDTL